MSDFDSDGPPGDEWSDRGELAWNEFDWERYLREQDETVQRYLGLYEAYRSQADRIDLVADQMGWEQPQEEAEPAAEEPVAEESGFDGEEDVYTLHKNPVYIATKAIYLGLKRPWELLASAGKAPSALAVGYLVSLHRGEEQAVQAINALDFGDYAMAVSLFKRALDAVNRSLALMNSEATASCRAAHAYREEALARLFDLREIWLRIIQECREELNRSIEE
ncbi:MAG TPA: hypothetical protein VHC86_15775 [Opitutaceae bacterium]|nr:hypothetical protein [Opitutaceae bacterium]